MEPEIVTLDVRPILAQGDEPLGVILAAVDGLSQGQVLRLIAPFRPVPLFRVMARRGVRVAPIDDVMLISYVLEGGLHGHGMDELARLHLGHEPIPFKSVAGTGKSQKSFKHVELKPATSHVGTPA